jgi:hypothetical protein
MVEISLSCQPGKEGNTLVFPYTVRNAGGVDVYVMDAMPGVDSATRMAAPNPQSVLVIHGPGEDATIGRFIAPLPTDRRVAMPIIPLARHLPRGTTLEGQLKVTLPLAEASPYFADLTLRQYEVVTIRGVVFSIGYWEAGVDGLAALPCEYAPNLFTVVTRNTARSARRVSQRFPVRALQLFRRIDEFPREIAAGSDVAMTEGELLASRITAAA